MKDYIYLDEDLLNSNLAQLNKGLPTNAQVEAETGSVRRTDAHQSTQKGLSSLFGIGSEYIKQNAEVDGFEMISSQREVLESVFHDHAVDLLLNSIPEFENLVTNLVSAQEGDYVHIVDKFSIYDFNYLSRSLEMELLLPIIDGSNERDLSNLEKRKKEISKQAGKNPKTKELIDKINIEILKIKDERRETESGINGLTLMKTLADYCKNLFPNTTLIRVENGLIFAKKEGFRSNIEQNSILSESKRKISIVGIVSSVKEKTYQEGQLADFKPRDLNIISSLVNDITLSSFDIMKSGDRLIKPIAIFFE